MRIDDEWFPVFVCIYIISFYHWQFLQKNELNKTEQ